MTAHSPITSEFKPPFWLRPAMVQTLIASQKFRKRGAHAMEQNAGSMILACGDGARLMGSYSAHPDAKALAVFLHGWEGSEASTYVMSCSRQLYDQGCSIFRLNFRDHGDSHHLNEEPFNAVRFDEVYQAVRQAAALTPDVPVHLIGFSLGGNFALRTARQSMQVPIENLAHIFAISPVIHPLNAAPIVDEKPLIRRYFYKKWTTSLAKKQAAFPGKYDFSDIFKHKNVMDLTKVFLAKYSDFESVADYFNGYKIELDDLADCEIPISVIMSEDDPVIPAVDMNGLQVGPKGHIIMHKYGGHNGFFQTLDGPTWYDDYIRSVIFP